jgi:hypothetical protein
MTPISRLVYAALIDLAWQLDGLKNPVAQIRLAFGVDNPEEVWEEIRDCWVFDRRAGVWRQPRLEQQRAEANEKSEKARRAALTGWASGRVDEDDEAAQALRQANELAEAKAAAGKPRPRPPKSSSSPTPAKAEEIAKGHPFVGAIPDGPKKVRQWAEALKSARKLWASPKALQRHLDHLAQYPVEIAMEAVELCEENQWTGVIAGLESARKARQEATRHGAQRHDSARVDRREPERRPQAI